MSICLAEQKPKVWGETNTKEKMGITRPSHRHIRLFKVKSEGKVRESYFRSGKSVILRSQVKLKF